MEPLGDYQRPGPLRQTHPDVWRGEMLTCPGCSYRFDAFGADDEAGIPRRPENDDWTMCLACGDVLRFVVGVLGLLVRPVTADELAEFRLENPEVWERLALLHAVDPPSGWPSVQEQPGEVVDP